MAFWDSESCLDWTSASASEWGTRGHSQYSAYGWTGGSSWSCDIALRLLCFEPGVSQPFDLGWSPAALAFVSSATGYGDLGAWPQAGAATGLAAGDAICRNLAAVAHLPAPESFVAWLSDSTHDARDRVTLDAGFRRVDNYPIADSHADLIDGFATNSLHVDEQGSHAGILGVQTGTFGDGTATADHCNGWTSATSPSTRPSVTRTRRARSALWTEGFGNTCESTRRIYCFANVVTLFWDGFESAGTARWSLRPLRDAVSAVRRRKRAGDVASADARMDPVRSFLRSHRGWLIVLSPIALAWTCSSRSPSGVRRSPRRHRRCWCAIGRGGSSASCRIAGIRKTSGSASGRWGAPRARRGGDTGDRGPALLAASGRRSSRPCARPEAEPDERRAGFRRVDARHAGRPAAGSGRARLPAQGARGGDRLDRHRALRPGGRPAPLPAHRALRPPHPRHRLCGAALPRQAGRRSVVGRDRLPRGDPAVAVADGPVRSGRAVPGDPPRAARFSRGWAPAARSPPIDFAAANAEIDHLALPWKGERAEAALHALLRYDTLVPAALRRAAARWSPRRSISTCSARWRRSPGARCATPPIAVPATPPCWSSTGESWEVVAAVSSTGYFDAERAGAIDYLRLARSSGSTLKPFLFAQALERGTITPASSSTTSSPALPGS